ncbi:citrate synthase 4, mitochondrial-like isoform X3 [Asparagus officinalis]|uniref:citrate synthase 4, mitochondrial-like isoform X3 n=1 Tax=Asparagus officinalis TaxID=4686 RepID=UPI00098E723A|nr:citrate synthase 4, mitochondrial-like isoform X3 [Asparagus officinalis]
MSIIARIINAPPLPSSQILGIGYDDEGDSLMKEWLKKLKSEHGKVQLGNSIVDMVIGGMRGTTGLLWETSLLDPDECYLLQAMGRSHCPRDFCGFF